MKVLHVVGARPNYMKTAPIMAVMGRYPADFDQVLVHTGQHYDYNMSKVFFEDLEMPPPNDFLNVGSGSHAEQTARTILAFEPVLLKHRPDWVMVVGDVNSTLACALVCAKLGVPVAHVEAGLRSRDWTMPEEVNRVLTDQMAGLLFTPSRDGDANLLAEGIASERIRFVGNVMMDTLVRMLPKAQGRGLLRGLDLKGQRYIVVTLHRPSNVDDPAVLREIIQALYEVSHHWPVVFPVHPRSRQRIDQLCLSANGAAVRWLEPLGYLDFLSLVRSAGLVITDSGGLQEETTYLGIPCLTVRPNTERPITVEIGTNRLVASQREALVAAVEAVIHGDVKPGQVPEGWDGRAAERIVGVMSDE
ncbi:MAG: UDP-N-acetylglucosamine 2-epimerase (non-hydrolyzing) [Chloroflexota bacterium]